ncbi:MAG: hypothetical protein IKU15_05100 [Clostridia bacterium]|nr:hypothetical protein [Clostridia bacterium]
MPDPVQPSTNTPATPAAPQQPAQPSVQGAQSNAPNGAPAQQNTAQGGSASLFGGLVTINETQARSTSNSDTTSLIPFSLGLENLAINNGTQGNASGPVNVVDVNLSGEVSGYWVTDPALKQVAMVMTVFQSFPVQVQGEDKPLTMVVDQTSTKDGAGTNKGALCIGMLGCPDGFDPAMLDNVAKNTKGGGFKVGASIWMKRGVEYFQHYFPEIGMTEKMFCALRRKCILNAEVVIPTSGTSGKAFRIKMVDEGPVGQYATVKGGKNAGLWKIDIIGAFCMLTENQSLFNVYGTMNGKKVSIDNTTLSFPFKDSKYDILTGEIPNYTPEAMLKYRQDGQVNANVKMVTPYYGHPVGNDTVCRVRFYVDPAHRAEAEQICGKTLPEELFKTNGNYTAAVEGGINMVPGDGSVSSAIRAAAVMVSNYCVSNGFSYGAIGGYVQKPDGLIIDRGRTIDCASGINCILATAGVLQFKNGEYFGNTAWWRSGGHLSKLCPGVTATKVHSGPTVDVNQLCCGDVLLYDRNRDMNNHLSLYISPTEKTDFGSDSQVKKVQPQSKSITKSAAAAGAANIVVWRFTKTGAAPTGTAPTV